MIGDKRLGFAKRIAFGSGSGSPRVQQGVMARVYLETSYVSSCVTDRNDTASAYRRQVSTGWWKEQRDKHTLFVAEEVLAELSHP